MYFIREIDTSSEQEIDLVATRMRMTLVDVLGQGKGESMYTLDWLRDRVLWHLSLEREAKVFLAEAQNGEIVAQAIVRVELDENNSEFGFFSTIYVEPEFRRQGVAKQLIQEVEVWCRDRRLPFITYNTAEFNERTIKLFEKYSFEIVKRESEMVQLKKPLS